jgi:hypothetical protein
VTAGDVVAGGVAEYTIEGFVSCPAFGADDVSNWGSVQYAKELCGSVVPFAL